MKENKNNGELSDLSIEIKKYKIEDGDVICIQLPNDATMQTIQKIQYVVQETLKKVKKKYATIIMTDPMDIYRLKPEAMATLGWLPINPDVLDRMNKSGIINYKERLVLMGMFKKLRSIRPINPQDLLDGNMQIIK
jgi:hypothetical protein